jgi:hypothetical protein
VSIADVVVWVMFVLLIGWLGVVLYATFHQLDGEAREAVKRRDG